MDLLDLVPSLSRQLAIYVREEDTDSQLAGYLADSIDGLSALWNRDYAITFTAPSTYSVAPDIAMIDKRPIVLLASIIYKMGNTTLASFTDGDFSWQLQRGGDNFISLDVDELKKYLPKILLAKATTAPMRGYNQVWNKEAYWDRVLFLLGS